MIYEYTLFFKSEATIQYYVNVQQKSMLSRCQAVCGFRQACGNSVFADTYEVWCIFSSIEQFIVSVKFADPNLITLCFCIARSAERKIE